MDWKFLISLLASFGALLFSFLNFKRSRRIENENHIYKSKLDIYGKLLGELNKLLDGLETNLDIAREYLEEPGKEVGADLDEHADEVDNLCDAFDSFVIGNSLIIPGNILLALGTFSNKISKTETLDGKNVSAKLVKSIDKLLAELSTDADEISALLRSDLHVDQLNTSLYNRLK